MLPTSWETVWPISLLTDPEMNMLQCLLQTEYDRLKPHIEHIFQTYRATRQ